jgi:quercetin dioxygenase-like cupin family protein
MRRFIVRVLRGLSVVGAALALVSVAFTAYVYAHGVTKPTVLMQQVVEDMPRGEKQLIRVMTATFQPGDQTVFHTHRFPVTVYVLEGAFTLELEGRDPVNVRAGEAYVEPPGVKMTGYNRDSSGTLKVLIFYVSDPDTPFLDPIT